MNLIHGKYITLLIVVWFCFYSYPAYSQEICPSKIIDVRNNNKYIKSSQNEDLFFINNSEQHYHVCEYHKNGRLMLERGYLREDGYALKHGLVRYFDEYGVLRTEMPYEKNYLEGTARYYSANKRLEAELIYKNGSLDFQNIKKHHVAIAEIPYKNDCPKHVYGVTADVASGQATHIKDTLVESIFIKDGFRCIYYTPLKDKRWELRNKEIPEELQYWGELSEQSELNKEHKLHGATRKYVYGNLVGIVSYTNGMKDGIEKKFYYGSGKLEYEAQYQLGKRYGFFRGYYKNGRIAIEAQFKNDNITGVVRKYRNNGELSAKVVFDKNLPVSGICYHLNGNERALTEAELEKVTNKSTEAELEKVTNKIFDCD